LSVPSLRLRRQPPVDTVDSDAAVAPLSVCLVAEGSYPHYKGGVSAWCDMLVSGLPEVSFDVMGLVADPGAVPVYELPANVRSLTTVPLWGTSEVLEVERDLGVTEVLKRKLGTPRHVIERRFVPLFSALLDALWTPSGDPAEFADLLREMAAYFGRYGYDVTMRSMPVWYAFQEAATVGYGRIEPWAPAVGGASLLDVTNAMRLLYRWLTPLAIPVPDVDIVHTASGGLCSIPGIVGSGRSNTAFLLTEHGIYLRERLLALSRSKASRFEQVFQAAFAQRITEASYAVADLIAPGSLYNQRWETHVGAGTDKLQTIYNGPDPAGFTPDRSVRPNSAPPTVTWLGRIDPLKDLETLIQAAALVVAQMPDVRFVLYGKAPKGNEWYQERCVALRDDLGLQDSVVFGGYASSAAAAYNEGDFVVLSSISEGFPYSVVEAMMCARTVVGTDVGGVGEALEGVGRVVEPRNPGAMADGMLAFLRAPEYTRELGELARERALRSFSLQQCNAAYLSAYQRLATDARVSAASLPEFSSWGIASTGRIG